MTEPIKIEIDYSEVEKARQAVLNLSDALNNLQVSFSNLMLEISKVKIPDIKTNDNNNQNIYGNTY